ncbi:trypsin-1-like [Vespula squamosa]|uniref:Chymotrypsin-2 n=1 Tax=Vespula squamosa TaxID=30214 RepID=A0ABD2ABK0_VESSQ
MLAKSVLAIILVIQACWASPLSPRITGGNNAEAGQFPYQVSVRWSLRPLFNAKHICGGSVLSKNYVLTAGHCVLKFGSYSVAAGKHYLLRSEETEQVVDVIKTIVHEDYKGGIAQHDIALLKLKTPLNLNNRVAVVAIPAQNEKNTGNAVLTGWGSVSTKIRPVLPSVLQTAVVPLLDNNECLAKLRSVKSIIGKKPELFPTQVCSGAGNNENLSACSGDSGGPLVQFVNKVPVQVGVVSWGTYPCGHGLPSVYTRVSSYVNWIKEHAT